MKGTVQWYDIRKGFGFIRGEDGKKVFVHKTEIPFFDIYLEPGQNVEYQLGTSNRGPLALAVKRI
ncbi:MAG TPA: cold shock domain-containing protein [Candidatus Thermoplasmatota archaeon]|nr:cold shock domain-containing protein [Candidatus Thermoplasmatota archaeon]